MNVGDRGRFDGWHVQAILIGRVVMMVMVAIAGVIVRMLFVMIVGHIASCVRMTLARRHDAAKQYCCRKQQAGHRSQAVFSHDVHHSIRVGHHYVRSIIRLDLRFGQCQHVAGSKNRTGLTRIPL